MHALLAAERIVTRTWARSVRLRTIGGIVAITALRSIGIVIVALCARSRNRSRLAALTAFALRTRSVADCHAGGNHPDEACAGRASGIRTWMLQDVPALERQALPRMQREQPEWHEAQE